VVVVVVVAGAAAAVLQGALSWQYTAGIKERV